MKGQSLGIVICCEEEMVWWISVTHCVQGVLLDGRILQNPSASKELWVAALW